MENNRSSNKIAIAALIATLMGVAGVTIWHSFFRDVPQPAWVTSNSRDHFLYGTVGAEREAGIPYWIWLTLPRIFPEYLPGPGGYASLGFSWEETVEMPVGFSKKTVGYTRVAGNCALCHAYSRPNGPGEAPTVFIAGTGRTAEVQKLLEFFRRCAQDPRFNANNILGEVDMWTKLTLLDRLLYRFIYIPRTRERLLNQSQVIVSAALWQHSRQPAAGPYREQLQKLETGLSVEEKTALAAYLRAAR